MDVQGEVGRPTFRRYDLQAMLDTEPPTEHLRPLGAFAVWVPGPPRPWQRAGRKGHLTFTRPAMETYRNLIFRCWADEGSPKLHSHNWSVFVEARWRRPDSHFLRDGISLSSIGRRMPHPSYCDLDNILKHIDVFVRAGAVSDDRYATRKLVEGVWAEESGVLFAFGEVE